MFWLDLKHSLFPLKGPLLNDPTSSLFFSLLLSTLRLSHSEALALVPACVDLWAVDPG